MTDRLQAPDDSVRLKVHTQQDGDVYQLRAERFGTVVVVVAQRHADGVTLWRARWVIPPERLPGQLVLDLASTAGMLMLEHRRSTT